MNYKALFMSILGCYSLESIAAHETGTSVHFSENDITGTITPSEKENIYVSKNSFKKLDPKARQDADKLARSIEFEVYSFGENGQSHTVFQSGGGVCYGYRAKGVAVIDSSTYYVNSSKQQYYANIADGTVNSKGDVKDVQYASVFNIEDPSVSKHFEMQDSKYGKDIAEKNLKERTKAYLGGVCK